MNKVYILLGVIATGLLVGVLLLTWSNNSKTKDEEDEEEPIPTDVNAEASKIFKELEGSAKTIVYRTSNGCLQANDMC